MEIVEPVASVSRRDYDSVRSYLSDLRAPYYDVQSGRSYNETPIVEITGKIYELSEATENPSNNRFYLKEEYKNNLTISVKGRAVASMLLNAIELGSLYHSNGTKKKWIEPTSGNTGKGLAELASLLGAEFTAVFSRFDVSTQIKNTILRFGGRVLTIGSEYSLYDLQVSANKLRKTVSFYWTMLGDLDEKSRSVLVDSINNSKFASGSKDRAFKSEQLKRIEGGFLIDPLLPLAVEASKSPIIERVEGGEFIELKHDLQDMIPELNNPDHIVAFLCSYGNSSMAVNSLISQLGFSNVCSIKGGMIEIKRGQGTISAGISDEFCPVPGNSISRSSIDFVKKIASSSHEYFSFMQYENLENLRAHELTTGPELLSQIPDLDAVVCTFGTGGTATGLSRFFKDKDVKVYVAFPESPVEGIRTLKGSSGLMFYQPELYAKIIEISNSRSNEVRSFLSHKNLRIGPSTVIALAAALDPAVNDRRDGDKKIAVIAADGMENYE